MRVLIVFLAVFTAILAWRWMTTTPENARARKWMARTALAAGLALVITLGLFIVSVSNSWRIW